MTTSDAKYGDDHYEMIASLGNVGISQWQLGRLEEAEHTFKRLLDTMEETFGSDHHEVAATLGNLARVQFQLGRPEAEATASRAVATLERLFANDHSQTQTAGRLLARIRRYYVTDWEVDADNRFQAGLPLRRLADGLHTGERC